MATLKKTSILKKTSTLKPNKKRPDSRVMLASAKNKKRA